jgi:D-sedoheptulose 7-phosphate isomerase
MLSESSQMSGEVTRIDEIFRREIEQHRNVLEATAVSLHRDFQRVFALVEECLKSGGKLLLFGNGGSAADAQHIAAELVVRYKSDRKAIAAIALTTDTSILTACGNDFGFEALFERQVEALGRKGDVAIGISTSGKSANVLRGLSRARECGLKSVGLTGGSGGEMHDVCDAALIVPSAITARIQEMHITLGHMLCAALESRLGPG